MQKSNPRDPKTAREVSFWTPKWFPKGAGFFIFAVIFQDFQKAAAAFSSENCSQNWEKVGLGALC